MLSFFKRDYTIIGSGNTGRTCKYVLKIDLRSQNHRAHVRRDTSLNHTDWPTKKKWIVIQQQQKSKYIAVRLWLFFLHCDCDRPSECVCVCVCMVACLWLCVCVCVCVWVLLILLLTSLPCDDRVLCAVNFVSNTRVLVSYTHQCTKHMQQARWVSIDKVEND